MKKMMWTLLGLVLSGALLPLVSHAALMPRNHNETLVRDTAE